MRRKNKKLPFWAKILISFFLVAIVSGGIATYKLYHAIYQPNVFLGERKTMHIYIPTGSTYEDVKTILYSHGMIINTNSFEWLAQKKNYKNHVKAGRYLIHKEMGNNELINLLRSGQQDPVNITFNNIRTKEQLAGVLSQNIEADSLSIISLLNNEEYLKEFELTPQNAKALFIPNTYQFHWNTSAKQLMQRMYREYSNFWTPERRQKAEDINLSPVEVSVLASIIQQESSKIDEYGTIAGVYINRLNRNMALQADPTVVFAVGDFSIRRVLNRHLAVDSPYNTYKYKGLPPGPIALPEQAAINGVLNYQNHDYLFFCAKDDFSGYHEFATNYRQHRINAARYQRALNQRRIMR